MATLKQDMATLKQDIATLKQDVATLVEIQTSINQKLIILVNHFLDERNRKCMLSNVPLGVASVSIETK